jgi:hypothetical protein
VIDYKSALPLRFDVLLEDCLLLELKCLERAHFRQNSARRMVSCAHGRGGAKEKLDPRRDFPAKGGDFLKA